MILVILCDSLERLLSSSATDSSTHLRIQRFRTVKDVQVYTATVSVSPAIVRSIHQVFSRIRLSTPALVPKVHSLILLLWNHYAPLHYQKNVVFHWVLKVTFAKDV